MVIGTKEFHEGLWLEEQIAGMRLSQAEFARQFHLPRRTLVSWLKMKRLGMHPHHRAALVAALGHNRQSFENALQFARVNHLASDPALAKKWGKDIAAARTITGRSIEEMVAAGLPIGGDETPSLPDDFPAGVDLLDMRPTKRVTDYAAGITADPATDRFPESSDDSISIEASPDREIVLTIRGSCQAPKFRNGDKLVFSKDIVRREGIISGKSYYVQMSDGRATFKRVFVDPADPDMLVLRCYNRKEFSKDVRVHRDEVSQLMRAVRKIVDVSE